MQRISNERSQQQTSTTVNTSPLQHFALEVIEQILFGLRRALHIGPFAELVRAT